MKIFDSHAHYDDERYDGEREAVIKEQENKGVEYIVNCGSDLKGLKKTIELCENHPIFLGALGIHPSNADEYNEDVRKLIEDKLGNPKIVAIGEIGLDYYWEDNPSKEVQMEVLNKQYEIARKHNKPVILHVRDAYGDMMDFLRKNNDVKAVLHSFSGSPEIAKELIDLGYYIGVGGVLTFKNSKKLPEVIRQTPLDRILTETDAPYLTPVPFRGKTNMSYYIEYVINKISEIKGLDLNEAENALFNNNLQFFNLK